jgi:hypothetical protein
MNTSKILLALMVTVFVLLGCGESQPCSTEVKYLQWVNYEVTINDSIQTFYGHLLKVDQIEVEKSVFADSTFIEADTIYTENDTTYIAADTTIVLDTILVNSSAQIKLYNIEEIVDSLSTIISVGDELKYGSENVGAGYSHVIIRCDSISFDTNFVRFSILNSEIYQDCSTW